jgi:RimJ/RimL family protein N-acetyltransferase
MVHSWVDDGERHARGYRLEFWDGVFPDALLDDAATFHHIMQTAPREDLDVADTTLRAADVVELDRALVEAGRQRWTIFVRGPDDQCVGGTEVTFESWQPTVALQQNTAIDPDHRGHGLAKWAKAAMLERIRDERPEVEMVRTGNAGSNAPMLAINDALGFHVVDTRTEWQAAVADMPRTSDGN